MKDILGIVAIVLSGLAFITGLFQYMKAQKWKRSEFASKLIEQLHENWYLSFCCYALDYSARRFKTPEEYTHYRDSEETFTHTTELMTNGVKTETEKASFEFPLIIYRDSFDKLFQFFENINHYINIGLIDIEDISPIKYWLEQVNKNRFNDEPVFKGFIEYYEYEGVTELMNKFSISPA